MAATLRTRKPANRLTLDDLEAFPIWEYADDEEGIEGQDETWVRPLRARLVPRGRYSVTVAADFTTPNRRAFRGFVDVTTAEGPLEVCQGVILDGREPYLFIPNPELVHYQQLRAAVATGLGLQVSDTFPLVYTLRVPLAKEKTRRSGKLP
jgi:hypothetical protein